MNGWMIYLCTKCKHEVTVRYGWNTCPNCKAEGYMTGSYDPKEVEYTFKKARPAAPIEGLKEAVEYFKDVAEVMEEEGLDRENNARHYRAMVLAARKVLNDG